MYQTMKFSHFTIGKKFGVDIWEVSISQYYVRPEALAIGKHAFLVRALLVRHRNAGPANSVMDSIPPL